MIFCKENYNDIVKYYSNNIIKLEVTGDRLWQITNINSQEVTLLDVDGFSVYIDLSEEYQVNFPLPRRAVYQCGGRAWCVMRRPAKQYNRGIHEQNTLIRQLTVNGWAGASFNLHTLQQFVDKPAYQDPNNLPMEFESWAISPVFSITPSRIYALDKQIGMVDIDNKRLTLTSSLFTPELKQLFPSWSIV